MRWSKFKGSAVLGGTTPKQHGTRSRALWIMGHTHRRVCWEEHRPVGRRQLYMPRRFVPHCRCYWRPPAGMSQSLVLCSGGTRAFSTRGHRNIYLPERMRKKTKHWRAHGPKIALTECPFWLLSLHCWVCMQGAGSHHTLVVATNNYLGAFFRVSMYRLAHIYWL